VTDLAARLYAAIAIEPGNLALSPHSVAAALGLVAYGARGRTRAEIEAVVGEGSLELPQSEWVELTSANRLFGQADLHWRPGLEHLLALVDYADVGAARAAINAWTSEQTRERIPEIVPTGVLDRETLLVLVNALYLKAAWQDPFPAMATADAPFHLADGSVVAVPTMLTHLTAAVGAGDGRRSVRLPYAGGTLAMTVVLPDRGRLGDVESLVAEQGWAVVLDTSGHERLELRMPRFTVRSSAALGEVLGALGMPTAFSDAADFSGFTTDEPPSERLRVSEVLHEAFVAVDELGTEAAAATAVAMQRAAALLEPPVPFAIDRPFVWAIHPVESPVPLFVGRTVDPR
jgi:serpin B